MRNRNLEFIIAHYVPGEHFTVIGRCGDLTIRIGDTFDTLARYKRPKTLEDYGREPVQEAEIPVSIRVTCVHAYERSLEALGEGMTGSLALEGDGLEKIAPGWVLERRTEEPTEVAEAVEPLRV